MTTREPPLRAPTEALRSVFEFHGPRRYVDPANPFNGAVAMVQSSDAFVQACAEGKGSKCIADVDGGGAVWGWFVGSPRAFLFGFSRSKRYAVRKMGALLRSEFEIVTGRKAQ